MERLTNLAQGCLRAELVGALPALALNALAAADVPFWDAEPIDAVTLRLTLHRRNLRRAERAAARARCEMRVLGEKGAPLYKERLKRRRAMCICALALSLILAASNLFIWDVRILGAETVSRAEIMRALDDCGVAPGTFWPSISAFEIKNEMLLRQPELAWAGVTFGNSLLTLRVRERVNQPELIDADEPYDVVASETGIIEELRVYGGMTVVQPGDAVLEGELLVSGTVDSLSGQRYAHARGGVMARVWYEWTACAPLSERRLEDTDTVTSRWALEIGKTRVNFYSDSSKTEGMCGKIVSVYPFAWTGVFSLPIRLVRESLREYETETIERDREWLCAELQALLTERLERCIGQSGEVCASGFTSATTDGMLYVTLRAECIKDIARERPLFAPP